MLKYLAVTALDFPWGWNILYLILISFSVSIMGREKRIFSTLKYKLKLFIHDLLKTLSDVKLLNSDLFVPKRNANAFKRELIYIYYLILSKLLWLRVFFLLLVSAGSIPTGKLRLPIDKMRNGGLSAALGTHFAGMVQSLSSLHGLDGKVERWKLFWFACLKTEVSQVVVKKKSDCFHTALKKKKKFVLSVSCFESRLPYVF